MPILLILTLDPTLEPEVESCLDGELVLAVDSLEAVRAARANLDARPVLLVDTQSFQPPASVDADVICIGAHALEGVPLLERPLRKGEMVSWISTLSKGAASHDASHQLLPSPFSEFQRDAVHDLNNQFTTLQGNLMLLADESDDPAFNDMTAATAKAIQIVSWMEWLGAGEFTAKLFDLQNLLHDFAPMFFRLRGRTTTFDVLPSGEDVSVRKDPQRLLALLIVLIDALPGKPERCNLSCGSQDGVPFLRCSCEGSVEPPLELPEKAHPWVSALNARLDLQPNLWTLYLS